MSIHFPDRHEMRRRAYQARADEAELKRFEQARKRERQASNDAWLRQEVAYLAWHLAAGRAALADRYWREWIEGGL